MSRRVCGGVGAHGATGRAVGDGSKQAHDGALYTGLSLEFRDLGTILNKGTTGFRPHSRNTMLDSG